MDYCISDIHGYYDLFCRLLEKIRFGGGDKLYVLGDIIDKGPDSIRLAKLLFSMPDVYCIAGNHEYDFLKYYRTLMMPTKDYGRVLEKPFCSIRGTVRRKAAETLPTIARFIWIRVLL